MKTPVCAFGRIASRTSVYWRDCAASAQYQAVDRLTPVFERRQRPICGEHARFLETQGFWIFPAGDGEATSLPAEAL